MIAAMLTALVLLSRPPVAESGLPWAQAQPAFPMLANLEAEAALFSQDELQTALSRASLRTWLDRLAKTRFEAALLARTGSFEQASTLLEKAGFIRRWRILQPEVEGGAGISSGPGSPRVPVGKYVTTEGKAGVVLQGHGTLKGGVTYLLWFEGSGQGRVRLQAPGWAQDFDAGPAQGTLTTCLSPSAGALDVTLELRGLQDFVLALYPLNPGERCIEPRKALEESLSGQGRAPTRGQLVYAMNRLSRLSADEAVALAGEAGIGVFDYWLLLRAFPEQPGRWLELCGRSPACASHPAVPLIEAEDLLRKGKVLPARQKLLAPESQPDRFWKSLSRRLTADLLVGLGMPRTALAALKKDASASPRDLETLFSTALAAGDARTVQLCAEEVLASFPGDEGLAGSVALGLNEQKGADAALAFLARLRSTVLEQPDMQLIRASIMKDDHRYTELGQLLELLLPRFPLLETLWRLRYESCLGSGDGACLEAAVRHMEARGQSTPPCRFRCAARNDLRIWRGFSMSLDEIRSLPSAATNGPVILADSWWIDVRANGMYTIYRQQAIEAGTARESASVELQAWYDSHSEELDTLEALVLGADGGVRPVDAADDVAVGSDEFNIYYDIRRYSRLFDGLHPKDRLVWTWRLSQHRGFGGEFSLQRFLQDEFPKAACTVRLSFPSEMGLRHFINWPFPGPPPQPLTGTLLPPPLADEEDAADSPVPDGSGKTLLTWELGSLPEFESLPLGPPDTMRSAMLVVGSFDSWERLRSWYAAQLVPLSVASRAMLAEVSELRRQSADRQVLLERLARMVSNDFRYVGMEFGVNAFLPYPAAQVFEQRFGDCKDQSLLLALLLREAGFDAQPVIVRTAPRGELPADSPPSLSVFDHAIVHVESLNLFLDPTAPYLGLDALPWQDQGATVLPLWKAGAGLLLTPLAPAEANSEELALDFGSGSAGAGVSASYRAGGARARELFDRLHRTEAPGLLADGIVSAVLPCGHSRVTALDFISSGSGSAVMSFLCEPVPSLSGSLYQGRAFKEALGLRSGRKEAIMLPFPFERRLRIEHRRLSGPEGTESCSMAACTWRIEQKGDSFSLLLSIRERLIQPSDFSATAACLERLDSRLSETGFSQEEQHP